MNGGHRNVPVEARLVGAREEQVERAMARFIGTLPDALRVRIAGGTVLEDNGARLDSRIAALMALAQRRGHGFIPQASVAQMRRTYARLNRVCGIHERRPVTTRDLELPTDAGTIGARFYRPGNVPAESAVPLLVFFHGGGFIIGDVRSYDGLARFLAVTGQLAVLSVEYRLGPEHPFPRAAEDGIDAFGWCVQNANNLRVDAARIAVGGDSAGGAIAAAIASAAASRGLPRPAHQFLIYPAVDRHEGYPSRARFDRGLPLTSATVAWFATHYASEMDVNSPLASPLLAPNPERLPPTYLLAAGFDPLVDEGRAYADRLRAAGVATTYDLRPTLSHAFVNLAGVVPKARHALRDGIRAVASALRAV